LCMYASSACHKHYMYVSSVCHIEQAMCVCNVHHRKYAFGVCHTARSVFA